ncbi:MAG: hypothetical protein WC812_00930 [Candidatus Pacearchaeota archaeon]|jgi:hypothetical protein
MKNKEIIKSALINALSTALYVVVIALFFYYGSKGIFENNPTIFIPIAILLLFVFSAALTGFLVFGKPIMLYLSGKKHEALVLFSYTLGILLIITIVALFFLIIWSK